MDIRMKGMERKIDVIIRWEQNGKARERKYTSVNKALSFYRKLIYAGHPNINLTFIDYDADRGQK